MTRAAEFYAMDPDELASRLVETRRELLNLRFQLATGQLDNVSQLKSVRRDVARVLTVLREMEIASTEGVEFEAPAPQPARVRAQRRDREVADGLEAEEIEIDVDDGGEDTDEEVAARPRLRRSRKSADTAEESGDPVDEAAEAAPARTRGRRSRQIEDATEVPVDADEEQ